VFSLLLLLPLVAACAVSEPVDLFQPDAGDQGAGGSVGAGGGAGGQSGAGGKSGAGGQAGAGSGGAGGGFGGAGGTRADAGAGGTRADAGAGGARADAGGGGGAGGAQGDAGAAPTFTTIYKTILLASCGGSNCHNPGSQRGIAFSTQSGAYNSIKGLVTPGNGAGSSFYNVVSSGVMPPGQRLSAANIAAIKAWIDAGALNN
jgi:hypothetical protein